MKRKIPKKQVIILCGGITAAIILVSLVTLFIRKTGKNDNIAGTKIVEETTVSLDRTTGMEKETISKETATSTEQVTTERKLETTTDKEKTTTEKETTELTVTTTNPTTTAKPTEAVTQPVKEVVTNPTTTAVTNNNNNQYRDPYTGDIISKEEYDSIMNEMNNPEPTTTQVTQENVYVLNDDGTINFKKSKIYGDSMNEILLNYILNSHEFQNHFAGKNIIHISGQNGMITHYIIYCHIKLENGELITFHFNENWNIIED